MEGEGRERDEEKASGKFGKVVTKAQSQETMRLMRGATREQLCGMQQEMVLEDPVIR